MKAIRFKHVFSALFVMSLLSTVFLITEFNALPDNNLLDLSMIEQGSSDYSQGRIILTLVQHVFTGIFL